ncbi:MAG: hypothetical protein IPJ34_01775 [Myxococcales bacterium]|nr:hypothetical protein [Myxococcales bacterium]
MKVLARVTREGPSVRVTCLEHDWSAVGPDEPAAVAALREQIVAYYTRVRSVAPPETPAEFELEIAIVEGD